MVRQGERLLTLAEAAKLAKLAPVTLRLLVSEGRIPGQKIGRDWLVAPSDVRAYLKTRRPPGRPPTVYPGV
jgi:excisionase family DNA binding protein